MPTPRNGERHKRWTYGKKLLQKWTAPSIYDGAVQLARQRQVTVAALIELVVIEAVVRAGIKISQRRGHKKVVDEKRG